MVDLDNVEKLVSFGQEVGADYTEVRVIEGIGRSLFAQQGNLISAGENPFSGIGIRVLKNGGMAFLSANSFNKSLLKKEMKKSISIAENSNRKHPLSLGEPVVSVDKWKVPVKQKLGDVDFDTFLGFVNDFSSAITNIKKPALVSTHICLLNTEEYKKYLFTSEGTKLECDYSQIYGLSNIVAKAVAGSEQRVVTFMGSGGWEYFKNHNFFDDLSEDTNQLTQIADKAETKTFSDPIDLVVGSEVAGIIAHENVGHPSEGDRIMGREAAQAGESFWKHYINNIGNEIVGSKYVSVSDDPTIEGSPGYYLYDDEGVPARKRELMIEGRLNEPLLNRDYGARFGLKSNGASRADGYNREPMIRMASTYIEPGDHSLEELLEDVRNGVYMKSFTEWNIDDTRYVSKYVGLECYLIKNGEITSKRLKRPVLETTSLGLFKSVDACGKTIEWKHSGTCGKGDPMQLAPVYHCGPGVRIRNIKMN